MVPNLIKFQLLKKKTRGLLVAAIFSTFICIAFLYISQYLKIGGGRFIMIGFGLAALSITIFTYYAYLHLRKEKFTAMYISDEGINDISTGNNIGTILWKDVEEIKILNDISNLKRKYIVLKVKNPNEYIDRETNRSKKRTLELKLQYYGSPICFSERALNCTFEQLKSAVFLKYEHYKETHT